jgi:3-oxoadipate enol-lactonase
MRRLAPSLLFLLLACSSDTPTVQSGYVEIEGGRLYYEDLGRGDPVVLIHGGFLDRRMWDPQFEVFARRFRVIRYDVRGHGLSPTDSVTFADHEDLRRLLDALEIPTATIVGLSMGGQIAVDFALSNPGRVSALVLAGPGLSGYPFDDEQITAYSRDLTEAFESGGFAAAIEVFARYWCDGPHREAADVDPEVRRKVMEMLEGSQQRWEHWGLARQLEPPAMGRLSELEVPTLVVLGDLDMDAVHEVVDLIAEKVPGARKAVIPGAAHMVSLERPAEFNELVVEFLSGLQSGR